jgi:hypothetical protein
MWRMTLKQRRRHGVLMARLDDFKRNPYAKVPDGYEFGANEEEDALYTEALETLTTLVEEIHGLEVAGREGN